MVCKVQHYHLWHWFSPMSLRLICLSSVHKVWYCSSVVYVDDILLTGSDSGGLLETKEYLKRYFVTKNMRRRIYFLGIEIAHQKHSILLSQQKYALDLLEET